MAVDSVLVVLPIKAFALRVLIAFILVPNLRVWALPLVFSLLSVVYMTQNNALAW